MTAVVPTVPGPSVIAHAPARLDFGGGWTDVPPYADQEGGTVCNLAITRRTWVVLGDPATRAGDEVGLPFDWRVDGPGARLALAALRRGGVAGVGNGGGGVGAAGMGGPGMGRPGMGGPGVGTAGVGVPGVGTWSDLPVGAGLGGSSALGVALAAACVAWRDPATARAGWPDDAARAALAEASRAVEVEDARIAGGRQDHYAAAFGGALRLDFGEGAPTRVTRLALAPATRATLERRGLVVYTGQSRISGETITAVLDAYSAGERRVVDALARLRGLAAAMADALTRGDVDALGSLVGEHWAHQRALHPAIPTARIDAIIAAGTAAGALGAKALGASGGGCVLLVAAEDREDAVRAAIAPFGSIVPWRIAEDGVTIAHATPNSGTLDRGEPDGGVPDDSGAR